MILRLFEPSDAAALSLLGRESFVAKFGHLYAPDDLEAFLTKVYAESVIAQEMARADVACCLAVDDDRLAAYCKLWLCCGWPEYARGLRVIELGQLYTDPALTGQGIGAKLMDWALTKAREYGADEIQLSVFSENFGAQRFYARYGFEKVGDTTFHVGNHIDHEFLFAAML